MPTLRRLALALTLTLILAHLTILRAADIMPLPAQFTPAEGRLTVTENFTVKIATPDPRLTSAIARLQHAWSVRTGCIFTPGAPTPSPAPAPPTLTISPAAPAPQIPAPNENESYTLTITPTAATLTAPTTTGVLRGLSTLTQLLRQDADGYYLPACAINDFPRFSWRGLMIDVSRRWHSVDEIKRILDGMELVKLNVLHLHLSDDQGFRIESKTHPELQQHGSDGLYFTQDQIRDIIRHAAARAIRVVPEFDIPGHASAWSVSHSELMSGPPRAAGEPPTKDAPQAVWDGTYRIERTWGIFDMVFDPANEATHAFFADFLPEMAALFPDPYFHIGGDENNGAQWNANPRIQKFIADNNLGNNAGLHAWFNNRIEKILSASGKILMGWDEILHPSLAPGALIQSWRGPEGIEAAARAGHDVILSAGYYIDLNHPASEHYAADPLPADATLTPEQQKHIRGGEATMWSEWTPSETIDSRIWPRTAAIAERLWSPADARDIADMYRRLDIVSLRLDEIGMQHLRNRTSLIHRLAGDRATPAEIDALRAIIDAFEPVKGYKRGQLQRMSQFDTNGHFADATIPDSKSAREFNNTVAAFLASGAPSRPDSAALLAAIRKQLQAWHDAAHIVAGPLAAQSPRLTEPGKMAAAFAKSIHLAEAALDAIETQKPKPADWRARALADLEKLNAPNAAAVEAPAIKGITRLVNAAP